MLESIKELMSNPVFAGIFGVGFVGGIVYYLKKVPLNIFQFLKNRLICTLEVTNDSNAFMKVNNFLTKNKLIKNTRNLRLVTAGNGHSDEHDPYDDSGRTKMGFSFAPGSSYFWYNGALVIVTYTSKVLEATGYGDRPHVFKKFEFTILTLRKDYIKNFIEDIEKSNRSDKVEIKLSSTSYGNPTWNTSLYKNKRPLESVVLNGDTKTEIVERISRFFNSKKWYADRGIPYRQAFLFKGAPGTGKTSSIFAFASHFSSPIYIMSLNEIRNDSLLLRLVSDIMPRSFVVIEDIDAIDKAATQVRNNPDLQNDSNEYVSNGVSLAGILNAIDGISTPEGVVFILTSNYPEKLDSALLRDGRINKIIEFKDLYKEHAIEMFRNFYPDYKEEISFYFPNTINPATLQEILMRSGDNPEKALNEISMTNVIPLPPIMINGVSNG